MKVLFSGMKGGLKVAYAAGPSVDILFNRQTQPDPSHQLRHATQEVTAIATHLLPHCYREISKNTRKCHPDSKIAGSAILARNH